MYVGQQRLATYTHATAQKHGQTTAKLRTKTKENQHSVRKITTSAPSQVSQPHVGIEAFFYFP